MVNNWPEQTEKMVEEILKQSEGKAVTAEQIVKDLAERKPAVVVSASAVGKRMREWEDKALEREAELEKNKEILWNKEDREKKYKRLNKGDKPYGKIMVRIGKNSSVLIEPGTTDVSVLIEVDPTGEKKFYVCKGKVAREIAEDPRRNFLLLDLGSNAAIAAVAIADDTNVVSAILVEPVPQQMLRVKEQNLEVLNKIYVQSAFMPLGSGLKDVKITMPDGQFNKYRSTAFINPNKNMGGSVQATATNLVELMTGEVATAVEKQNAKSRPDCIMFKIDCEGGEKSFPSDLAFVIENDMIPKSINHMIAIGEL